MLCICLLTGVLCCVHVFVYSQGSNVVYLSTHRSPMSFSALLLRLDCVSPSSVCWSQWSYYSVSSECLMMSLPPFITFFY